MERDGVRTVWFYRNHHRLTGGHLKHSHYFDHVRRMEGFASRIVFGDVSSDEARVRERARLWPSEECAAADHWAPGRSDLLFVAGVDWRFLKRRALPMSEPYRPLLDFMIVGVQKGGTNALYRFLREHPEIGMSSRKEVHLFDAPDYSGAWTPGHGLRSR